MKNPKVYPKTIVLLSPDLDKSKLDEMISKAQRAKTKDACEILLNEVLR